jgi:hypothetical protein
VSDTADADGPIRSTSTVTDAPAPADGAAAPGLVAEDRP